MFLTPTAYITPQVSDFKKYFNRDFPYGSSLSSVQDNDISKALVEASFNVNPALFTSQEQYTVGYLYLTAHYLVMDLRASSQGISGQFNWLTSGKSVGSVNESFAIPDRILQNPVFASISKTYYGAKYLSLIISQTVGPMFTTFGNTKA